MRGGERYELCRSVHAEANALISASRAHDRRVAVSDRCRCENRRVCGKIELLFDVQAHGNQCRN